MGVSRTTTSIVGKVYVRTTVSIVFLVIGALLAAYLSLMIVVMASNVGATGGGSGSNGSEDEITSSEITDGDDYNGEILRKEQFKQH